MNRTRRIATLTLSLLVLGAACGTSQPSTSSQSGGFAALADWAGENTPTLHVMNDHVKAGTAALDDYDTAKAAKEFRAAADVLDGLMDVPTDTHAGELTLHAFVTCQRAYNDSADAVEALDVDAMNTAKPEIEDCVSSLDEATAALPS